ncbi:MAG: UDP-N-acetylmuramoyl-L-alanyl-D-glutamate--2,6-diaminopimelate ligase [Rikenellaceae bacterium]
MKINYKGRDLTISQLCFDSRKVVDGAMFVAIKGISSDGHNYISKAIESGAKVIVCENMPQQKSDEVVYIAVDDSNKALSELSSLYYGNPSSKLKLVGVTGTNGKTTTATLLYEMFRNLGHKSGLISTVIYKIDDKEVASSHTTPDVLKINELLSQMVEAGCEYCFMEVSSHSVVQGRIDGLHFTGGIFTNITHDHLDYHGTFAEYIKAKKGFFDALSADSFALYNSDDKNGSVMVQNCKATCRSYALRSGADYKCKIIESHMGAMLLQLNGKEVWVNLIGGFNGYNISAVYGAALELGVDRDDALCELSKLKSVAGRFDYVVSKDGVTAIVDYAHTPDALENVLRTIEEIREPHQKIITVVGCGGNRDKTKRPEMAKIAADMSDFTILTSDNPRFEEPEDILKDMEAALIGNMAGGVNYQGRYTVISDRAHALSMSSIMAKGVDSAKREKGLTGDIILIAGKGHEPYQEIKGVRNYFNDKEIINDIFEARR